MKRIYLDCAATTPLLPEAFEKMKPWLTSCYGNPSSLYQEGRRAKEAIDTSREVLSDALDCLFGEVLFTSSGTESANLALIGVALANKDLARQKILLGAAEHHSVLETQKILSQLGYQVELIPVTKEARVSQEDYLKLLGPDVLLVGLMHANNELGTLNPIRWCVDRAKEHGTLFFCDTVQSFLTPFGRSEEFWKVEDLGVDLLAVSAHKVYGPKGVGALYVRAGTAVDPLIYGGGQEREMRGGTENVAGVVGFAEAVKWSLGQRDVWKKKAFLREVFLERLREQGAEFVLSVQIFQDVLPGHLHLRFPGISAESILIVLDQKGVCASSGAACSSGSLEPSHVLLACGYSKKEAMEGLRFTFDHFVDEVQVRSAAEVVAGVVNNMKSGRA